MAIPIIIASLHLPALHRIVEVTIVPIIGKVITIIIVQ